MKSKKLPKKLSLNKKTISKLDDDVNSRVHGGNIPPLTMDVQSLYHCCPEEIDTTPLRTCP